MQSKFTGVVMIEASWHRNWLFLEFSLDCCTALHTHSHFRPKNVLGRSISESSAFVLD